LDTKDIRKFKIQFLIYQNNKFNYKNQKIEDKLKGWKL